MKYLENQEVEVLSDCYVQVVRWTPYWPQLSYLLLPPHSPISFHIRQQRNKHQPMEESIFTVVKQAA